MYKRTTRLVLHTCLTTTMYHLPAAPLRILPRLALARAFHSPFVALNATNRLTTPHTASPMYEKQHDSSPEPHLSSSGTRTYTVSEPDPSNTPFQVPSGAYPASASYLPNTSINTRAVLDNEAGVGKSAAPRSTAAPGETGRRTGGTGLADTAGSK